MQKLQKEALVVDWQARKILFADKLLFVVLFHASNPCPKGEGLKLNADKDHPNVGVTMLTVGIHAMLLCFYDKKMYEIVMCPSVLKS